MTAHIYRPDIDGLRAVAVLAVIGYHFKIGYLHGGFIGVDIFFVISGYLISQYIIGGLERGRFSFLEFYQRRIRRIFPALVLVLLCTYAYALWSVNRYDAAFDLYSPASFAEISENIAAGAAFASNFLLWNQPNYFSQTPILQPLLHLWSLAIEEQFYIVWPLLLFVASRIRLNYLILAAVLCVGSFYVNLATVYADPVGAFYSPLSRGWELMVGAVLACVPLPSKKSPVRTNAFSVLGLALIATGLAVTTNTSVFPGWLTLLPTIGAAFVIAAGSSAWLNKLLLGNKPLVGIGLISYPLYLWHWPILFLHDKYSATLTPAFGGPWPTITATFLFCLVISWLTYALIEKPVRFGRHRKLLGASTFALMVAIGVWAQFTPNLILTAGLSESQRSSLAQLRKVTELKDIKKMYGTRSCFKNRFEQTYKIFLENGCVERSAPGQKSVFLIGDSHSASLSLGIRPLLEAAKVNFLQVSTGWCEPTINNPDGPDGAECLKINALVMDKISEIKPDVVIINLFWNAASTPPYFIGGGDYFAHLLEKIADIKGHGAKRVIVVGEIPVWGPTLPAYLAYNFVRNEKPIPIRALSGIVAESLAIDDRMRAIAYPDGVKYVSLRSLLCNDDGCLVAVGPDLERDLIVWDDGHLTVAGAKFATRALIEPELSDILKR